MLDGAALAGFNPAPRGLEYVGAGTIATGVNPSVSPPSGVRAGDILIILGVSNTNNWSAIGGGWTTSLNHTATAPRTLIGYKTATDSESSVALTNAASLATAVMVAYRPNPGVAALDVAGTVATGTSTSPATSALSANHAGATVISLYGVNGTDTFTAPAGVNARVNNSTSRSLLICDEYQTRQGSSTVRTATISGSSAWVAFNLAFSQR